MKEPIKKSKISRKNNLKKSGEVIHSQTISQAN